MKNKKQPVLKGADQVRSQDTYFLERIIETQNFKAEIYRPVLTTEERKKRMRNIYIAAANLLKEEGRKK